MISLAIQWSGCVNKKNVGLQLVVGNIIQLPVGRLILSYWSNFPNKVLDIQVSIWVFLKLSCCPSTIDPRFKTVYTTMTFVCLPSSLKVISKALFFFTWKHIIAYHSKPPNAVYTTMAKKKKLLSTALLVTDGIAVSEVNMLFFSHHYL